MAVYYLDVDSVTGALTGTLNFTNGSTTVTGTGTLFTTELQVGDYIRSTDATNGGVWYKVTGITDDLTLTINQAFCEASHSASAEYNRGDGSQTAPFCHIHQFIADIALAAGDVLYCQSGQTLQVRWSSGFTVDGKANNPIKIIGSDWKNLSVSDYFYIDENSLSTTIGTGNGAIDCWGDYYIVFENLCFQNRAIINYGSIRTYLSTVKCKSCKFVSVYTAVGSYIGRGCAILENCVFDGTINAIGSDVVLYLKDPTFITTPTNVNRLNASISIAENLPSTGINHYLNSDLFSPLLVIGADSTLNIAQTNETEGIDVLPAPFIDGILIDGHKTLTSWGSFENDTATTFSSGNTAIKIIPNNSGLVGADFPQCIAEFVVDNVLAGTYTATVLVKTSGVTVFPTAGELFIEVLYPDQATGPHLGRVRSTEVITADNAETSLTATFTSAQDGRIRVRVWYGYNNGVDTAPILYVENGFTLA